MGTNHVRAGSLALLLTGIVACAGEPTAVPSARPQLMRPAFNLGPGGLNLGEIIVCSTGSGASFTVAFSGNFNSANAKAPPLADAPNPYTLTLANAGCVTVWDRATTGILFDANIRAVVTQTGSASGFAFSSVSAEAESGNMAVADQVGRSASVEGNMYHDARVTFVNAVQPCDFTTFGGFVLAPNNVSYGGNAGVTSRGVLFGELDFENHTNGDHIHVHTVTSYIRPASGPLSEFPETRQISGPATLNGADGYTAVLRLTDRGEPGLSDRIWMQLTGPGGTTTLIPAMTVDGGNVQLHDVCRPAPLNGPVQNP
jgi:hypothetical protein